AGVFSAFGMLMSDIRRDYIRTHVVALSSENRHLIQETFTDMEFEAIENFKIDGYKRDKVKFTYHADLRYAGQEHYVKIILSGFSKNTPLEEIIDNFHVEHKRQYAFDLDASVELVNFHLVAEVKVEKPDFPKIENKGSTIKEAQFDIRNVDFDDLGIHKTKFFHRDLLEPEMIISGPAIIAEKETTTVVTPIHTLQVDVCGNLILTQQPQ
ncbi:MAG: hypothetical protein OXH57_08860, partial [Ekhidna sp.]|nr:hypothetical protein [Ekhidna sp.]